MQKLALAPHLFFIISKVIKIPAHKRRNEQGKFAETQARLPIVYDDVEEAATNQVGAN